MEIDSHIRNTGIDAIDQILGKKLSIVDDSGASLVGEYTSISQSLPTLLAKCSYLKDYIGVFKISPATCEGTNDYFKMRIDLTLAVKKLMHVVMNDCEQSLSSGLLHKGIKLQDHLNSLARLYSRLCLDELIDHPSREHASIVDKIRISTITQTKPEPDPYVAHMRTIELPTPDDLTVIRTELQALCQALLEYL
jgi:hypothetical protein